MVPLIRKLRRTGLLTKGGVLGLLGAITTGGVNLMAMLRVAARLHPERVAVIDERGQLTYGELWSRAQSLAGALSTKHGIRRGRRVAIACGNHAVAVETIFAASRLGANVYLVNPESSVDQLLSLDRRHRFDLWIYDDRCAAIFADPLFAARAIPAYHPTEYSINTIPRCSPCVRIARGRSGTVVVMTGGTTGRPKSASRKPSLLSFLSPFAALLTQLHLDRCRSVYIATPIYHGFGLASLLVSVILGAEIHLAERFDAARGCELIAERRIEAVTLVPLMLGRMMATDASSLGSLRCIISGGARLAPALANETLVRLGPVLFNLYGTSEAGFAILAGPDCIGAKPASIGRPVRGVRVSIVDEQGEDVESGTVGHLQIESAWATSRSGAVATGDLAWRDRDGDIFLSGRVDDMIVSGGENVYPVELENVLAGHPDVEAAAVVGIPDREFGQRLKAVVVPKHAASLDAPALHTWLKTRVARYQMPAVIELHDELPYTSLGKVDKHTLWER